MKADPDLGGMELRPVGPLRPFLGVCISCGVERSIRADRVSKCKCGARRWGVAGCGHCRALVEAERSSTMVTEEQVYNAILTEAWEKFHEARHNLNELADMGVEPAYAHNRAKRLLWEVRHLTETVNAIYALTPLPEEDEDDRG